MFSKIPLLIVCVAALFSTCNKNTDFGKYVGPYKKTTEAIQNLPSFSECTLASNLELKDNIPFILSTSLNETSNSLNQFSLEFNTKYNNSKVGVVGIEWKIDGKKSQDKSTNLDLKMAEGKEYDIICSVYSTDFKSVYKKDIEFCAVRKPKDQKLKFNICKPVNIMETNCNVNSNTGSKAGTSKGAELLRAIAIILPYSKNTKAF